MAIPVEPRSAPDVQSSDSLERGITKRLKWRVGTRDDTAALFVPGIPRKGDALNPTAYPGTVALNITARPLGGKNEATGQGGWSEVVVDYGPEIELPFTSLPPNRKHTVISINNESVEVGSGLDDAGQPVINTVFNNKKPGSKLAGRITAEVYDFRPLSYNVPFATLIGLATDKALNSDNVTLPAPLGTTQSIAMAPKQVLYMGFKVELTNSGAILITHELQLALDFKLRWAVPDLNGKILRVDSAQLYRTAAFSSLW